MVESSTAPIWASGQPQGALGSWLSAAIIVAVAVVLWLSGRFIVSRIVRRVSKEPRKAEYTRLGLRWAQSTVRPWDSERRTQRARTVGSLLTSVYGVVLVVVTGIYVLLAFGVNITPVLASFGIIGVTIGFGCQQLIRDFLAGIFLTLEDQFGIGDVIETSEVVGTVESVGLRITRVRGKDGAVWYLRNGEILQVGNHSQGHYQDQNQYRDPGPMGETDRDETQEQRR